MNIAWILFYFILGIIFYIYIFKIYFDYLNKNNFFSKKVSIRKEKFLWGEEDCWTNNKKYIAKNIFLKKRSVIARKYHKNTVKTVFVISGSLHLYVEKSDKSHDIILHPEDAYEIYPETIYIISAITNVKYIEVSSYTINDTYTCKKDANDRQRHRNFTRKYD